MQEKKNLDAVAEKYKEEMMRIYSKKRPENVRQETGDKKEEPCGSSAAAHEGKCSEHSVTDVPKMQPSFEVCGDKKEAEVLMRPPMPHIPYNDRDSCEPEEPSEEKDHDEKAPADENCRFPTAEELIKLDCGCDEEKAVPTASMNNFRDTGETMDTRFDSAGSPDHAQGNYIQYSEDEKGYESGNDDVCGIYPNETGHGYLQVEVTDSASGAPIAGAYVAVIKKIWDSDILQAMLITDSQGMTEAMELAVSVSEDRARPYDEYMVTVYKDGFYSVAMLPVPIFDTIKSIQPVEMNKAGKEC